MHPNSDKFNFRDKKRDFPKNPIPPTFSGKKPEIEMVTLPDDICRCWDETCAVKNDCKRWLARHFGGPYVVSAESCLYEREGKCINFIAKNK